MGIQDPGGASGWPATDWLEDLVMRYGGASQVQRLGHPQDQVRRPCREAGRPTRCDKLLFTDGNVAGGAKGAANTNWQTVANPMFASNTKPGCWMQKQGNFITGFFPKAVQSDARQQRRRLRLPARAPSGGDNPTVGGGDLATLLNNSKNAQKVMKLMSPDQPRQRGREVRGLHLPAQGLRHQPLPEHDRQGCGRRGLQVDVVPLRRLGRDAGRRRRRARSGSRWSPGSPARSASTRR